MIKKMSTSKNTFKSQHATTPNSTTNTIINSNSNNQNKKNSNDLLLNAVEFKSYLKAFRFGWCREVLGQWFDGIDLLCVEILRLVV